MIWRSTGRSDEKGPTLAKHCACALRQASDLSRTVQNSIGNRSGGLVRKALRKGRSEKLSRGLPGASWDRFGSVWEHPGSARADPIAMEKWARAENHKKYPKIVLKVKNMFENDQLDDDCGNMRRTDMPLWPDWARRAPQGRPRARPGAPRERREFARSAGPLGASQERRGARPRAVQRRRKGRRSRQGLPPCMRIELALRARAKLYIFRGLETDFRKNVPTSVEN